MIQKSFSKYVDLPPHHPQFWFDWECKNKKKKSIQSIQFIFLLCSKWGWGVRFRLGPFIFFRGVDHPKIAMLFISFCHMPFIARSFPMVSICGLLGTTMWRNLSKPTARHSMWCSPWVPLWFLRCHFCSLNPPPATHHSHLLPLFFFSFCGSFVLQNDGSMHGVLELVSQLCSDT